MVCLALLLAVSGCAGSDGKVVLKVAHNGSAQHPYQVGFETFKEVLERETDGLVEVQIFENEQLGTEEEASLMVELGALAASAASAGGGLAPFTPEAELFNFPFIFRDLDHFYRVLDGPPGKRIGAAVEEKLDALVLGWWFSGVRNTWNSKHPILTPDDMRGLKIRVMSSPVLIETFNTLGAQATPMSFGELYSGLEQHVVDGAETDHVDLLYERFYEVTKYVSYTGHMYLAAGLIFSRKRFDELPPEVQEAVLLAGREATIAERAAMESMSTEALTELQRLGLEFNEVDRRLFHDKVRTVYENNAEKVGGIGFIEEIEALEAEGESAGGGEIGMPEQDSAAERTEQSVERGKIGQT
jgi:tripartite ATP-independent transporter DctP family solute receptor